MKPNAPKDMQQALTLAFVGFEMVATILVGILVDWHWNCWPWGVSIGAAVGLIGGVGQLYLMVRHWERMDQENHDSDQLRDS